VRDVHFVPGFPVMAHPMIEWLLDTRYRGLHGTHRRVEQSVIVTGAMEATLTPLMEQIESRFPGVKVFSLPSVDHPQWGRHIELGVKGEAQVTPAAFAALKTGLAAIGATLGAEVVR
jgi:molybdopterin-biosynthesis enzyme MoeA-like protein